MSHLKRFLLVLVCLAVPAVVHAQTTTSTLSWFYLTDTLTNINAYTTGVKVDAGALTQVTPTCAAVAAPNNVQCSVPLPLAAGTHTITVVAVANGQSASGSLNFTPGPGPATPTKITIVINVTIP